VELLADAEGATEAWELCEDEPDDDCPVDAALEELDVCELDAVPLGPITVVKTIVVNCPDWVEEAAEEVVGEFPVEDWLEPDDADEGPG
jgi:hypothetical protein